MNPNTSAIILKRENILPDLPVLRELQLLQGTVPGFGLMDVIIFRQNVSWREAVLNCSVQVWKALLRSGSM